MAHRRSDGLHPLIRLVVALAAVGICFVWLWGEWDRRVEKGFPAGQRPTTVESAPAAPPPPSREPGQGVDSREQAPRFPATAAAPASAEPPIDVYFSPGGGATDTIVRELVGAKERVRVQAYSFTSAPIAKALVDAKRLDDSQQTDKYSSATFLHNNAVPCSSTLSTPSPTTRSSSSTAAPSSPGASTSARPRRSGTRRTCW